MKKKVLLIAIATTFLFSQLAVAQSGPNNCPRYGTPQQGQGPRDGAGYGAQKKKGNRTGPQNGQGQRHGQQGRGARR